MIDLRPHMIVPSLAALGFSALAQATGQTTSGSVVMWVSAVGAVCLTVVPFTWKLVQRIDAATFAFESLKNTVAATAERVEAIEKSGCSWRGQCAIHTDQEAAKHAKQDVKDHAEVMEGFRTQELHRDEDRQHPHQETP